MCVDAIQTFSVGYPDGGPGSETTEFAFARLVAERFGTVHRELELGPDQYWQSLGSPDLALRRAGCGSRRGSALLSVEGARDFVTVVLSGEGADEMLAGYVIYQKMLTWNGSPHSRGPPRRGACAVYARAEAPPLLGRSRAALAPTLPGSL